MWSLYHRTAPFTFCLTMSLPTLTPQLKVLLPSRFTLKRWGAFPAGGWGGMSFIRMVEVSAGASTDRDRITVTHLRRMTLYHICYISIHRGLSVKSARHSTKIHHQWCVALQPCCICCGILADFCSLWMGRPTHSVLSSLGLGEQLQTASPFVSFSRFGSSKDSADRWY